MLKNLTKFPGALYSTGSLYGTRIENVHIIEHKVTMGSKLPLVILYPGTYDNDKLLYLNTRVASKYRCYIV